MTRVLAAAVAARFDPDRPVHPWTCGPHVVETIGCPRDSPGWRARHTMVAAIRAAQPWRPAAPPFPEWLADEMAACRPGTPREIAARRSALVEAEAIPEITARLRARRRQTTDREDSA